MNNASIWENGKLINVMSVFMGSELHWQSPLESGI